MVYIVMYCIDLSTGFVSYKIHYRRLYLSVFYVYLHLYTRYRVTNKGFDFSNDLYTVKLLYNDLYTVQLLYNDLYKYNF